MCLEAPDAPGLLVPTTGTFPTTITLTRRTGQQKLLPRCLLRFALNIDLALQVGAFFNRNALRADVAGHDGRLAQLNPVAGLHVALKLALHHHSLGLNRRFDLAVGADGQAVALEGDAALDLTIHVKVFAARQFAFDD